MSRTDTASRTIAATCTATYDALVDPAALEVWLPPEGMTARFEHFDLRPGGSYRIVLSHLDTTGDPGKTTSGSDVVDVRFVELDPGRRVVQAVDFVAEDPAFAGTMIMTWSVTAVDGCSRVDIVADHVPVGISAEDHAAGLASSLEHLATYLEHR